jgi:hypothetical protein
VLGRKVIKVLNEIKEILSRGNTAEVKKVKDGIVVLEVQKKIRCTDAVMEDEDKGENVINDCEKKVDDGGLNAKAKGKS